MGFGEIVDFFFKYIKNTLKMGEIIARIIYSFLARFDFRIS